MKLTASLLAAATLALLCGGARADAPYPYKRLGYCRLSVTSSAVQTSTCTGFPADADYAVVCDEGAAARWRDDGTAPTATVGQPMAGGSASAPTCMPVAGDMSALQWIAQSGTATLDFVFYK